jgi:predicted NAD/FAD-dependent oxidoreductase
MKASLDRPAIRAAFALAVNMDADEIEAWLATPESRAVGQKTDGATESVGHASGRRIALLLRNGPRDEADYAHMRKVVGFVRRHGAQEPANMVTSRWRYSLMNWGHDPLRA